MDDLCSWEEFERLVLNKTESSGEESEERSAARDVVSDAGRLHTRLSDLKAGPTLVSFFCRVIQVKKASRFDRPDGGHGYVSRILCGDDSGEVVLTLWDEKAFASGEFSEGEVLEVVGRLKRRGTIDVADLRKPEKPPEIQLRDRGMRTFSLVTLNAVILAFAGEGSFQGADEKVSRYIRLIVGDDFGEAEVMFWNNDAPKGFRTGANVSITGISERPSSGAKRSYSADENSGVSAFQDEKMIVERRFLSGISDIHEGWSGSISVIIEEPGDVREFVTRKGNISYVRNLQVYDESGKITIVVWGEQACLPFLKGDKLDIFFAEARVKSGERTDEGSLPDIEIHAGYQSFVSFSETGGETVFIRGFIVPRNGYFSIDNSEVSCPLKELKEGMKACMEAEMYGVLYDSGRIEVKEFSEPAPDSIDLKSKIEEVKKRSGC
ncbi:MAG: hypothetical protein JW931_06440 [Methanomicrobiaceae archaeon]|nr:hypothetical protein [Methanomicrobiaceae archaeon]